MSTILIDAKTQMRTLLGSLSGFSGSSNVVERKLDVFEQAGASVTFGGLDSERLEMSGLGMAEREARLVVTVAETLTPAVEDQLLTLAIAFERDVETARRADSFPAGLEINLDSQAVTIAPDDPSKGVLTQIYTLNYTETLTL